MFSHCTGETLIWTPCSDKKTVHLREFMTNRTAPWLLHICNLVQPQINHMYETHTRDIHQNQPSALFLLQA